MPDGPECSWLMSNQEIRWREGIREWSSWARVCLKRRGVGSEALLTDPAGEYQALREAVSTGIQVSPTCSFMGGYGVPPTISDRSPNEY
jgi:hypothetical protein